MSAAVIAAGTRLTGGRPEPSPRAQGSDKAKLARIGSMTANFGTVLKDPARPNDANRTFELLDLPQAYAERLGVRYIEPTCSHFASTEKAYLDQFKANLKKAGIELNQISLGALATPPGSQFPFLSISSPQRFHRLQGIDLIKKWIDHAAYLGCPRVMVHQGELPDAVRKETIEAMKIVTDYGKSKNVKATIELRQSDWRVIVDVVKGAGGWTNCHTNNPAEALRAMLPISSGSTHVSYGGGRNAQGDPAAALHNALVETFKPAGYNGVYSIEHTGPDPWAAVKTVVDALVKDI
jgi:sugar phosphate isomerase/epimerase